MNTPSAALFLGTVVDPRLVRDATITVDLVMKDGTSTQFVIPVDTMTFDTNMPHAIQLESKSKGEVRA